jgi:hypothetical protein
MPETQAQIVGLTLRNREYHCSLDATEPMKKYLRDVLSIPASTHRNVKITRSSKEDEPASASFQ